MGQNNDLLQAGDEHLSLRALAERIAEIEERLRHDAASGDVDFSDDKLAVLASSIYRARQRRLKHFDADLFSEPAWDMLLDLFVRMVRGERVSATSLCQAARVPQATGLRCIELLVTRGLAKRVSTADDRRLSLVELTVDGFRRVRAYIVEGIGKFEMPAAGAPSVKK